MSRLRSHARLLAFAVLVLLQALAVVALVVREERLRAVGREIVLKAVPVDPRDLLRGDYVILGYEVQDLSSFSGPAVVAGDRVDVDLRRSDRYWVVSEFRRVEPGERTPEPGAIFLRGTVESVSFPASGQGTVRVAYANLDRYYVPQGTGNLPKPPDVVVIVDGNGNARIKRLEIDGKPWPEPAR